MLDLEEWETAALSVYQQDVSWASPNSPPTFAHQLHFIPL